MRCGGIVRGRRWRKRKSYGRWGVQNPSGKLENALKIFRNAQKNEISLTLVTINKGNRLPVAMGSLWKTDSKDWPDKTPWIASLYTLYRYR